MSNLEVGVSKNLFTTMANGLVVTVSPAIGARRKAAKVYFSLCGSQASTVKT